MRLTLPAIPKSYGRIERGFEIISEASRAIPMEIEDQYRDIPWRAIASIGNHLRPRYWTIDPVIQWEMALWQLPNLQEALQNIQRNTKQ